MRVTSYLPPGRVAVRGASGFTLLEVLVSLVITTLLATLVFQGLGLFLSTTDNVRRAADEATARALRQTWFAESLRGLVAYFDGPEAFRGDARSLSGVSLSSLGAEPGLPRRIHWSIDAGGELLRYRALGQDWPVYRDVGEQLYFDYVDRSGASLSQWRPDRSRPERIPAEVRLRGADGEIIWSAHLRLSPLPITNFREFD